MEKGAYIAIGVLLGAVTLGYFSYKAFCPHAQVKDGVKEEDKKEVDVPEKKFKRSDLWEFDGSDDKKPIYLGCNGFVFDVSSS